MSDERMIRTDNLRLLMRQQGMNKADVARRLGTSDTYVSKLMSGRPGTFGEKAARRVEDCFEKPRFWLDAIHSDGDYDPETLASEQQASAKRPAPGLIFAESPSPVNLLPVITWEQLNIMLDKENNDSALEACEFVQTDYQSGSRTKWVQLAETDTSMMDRFPPGTKLLVDLVADGATAQPGQYVLVCIDQTDYAVRRYKHVSKGRFLAEPLNAGFATLDSSTSDISIVGLVRQALITL